MRSLEEIVAINDPVYIKHRRVKQAWNDWQAAVRWHEQLQNSDADGMSVSQAFRERYEARKLLDKIMEESFRDL